MSNLQQEHQNVVLKDHQPVTFLLLPAKTDLIKMADLPSQCDITFSKSLVMARSFKSGALEQEKHRKHAG